jgi:hypothetical protein
MAAERHTETHTGRRESNDNKRNAVLLLTASQARCDYAACAVHSHGMSLTPMLYGCDAVLPTAVNPP